MSKDCNCKKKKGFGKLLVGAGIGAGITALFTTKKGQEYQKQIADKCEELITKVKNIDVNEIKEKIADIDIEDVKATVENKVEEIKAELADLDKEKVEKAAQKKAKEIEAKTKELVDYAIEKGTPVIEEAANNLRKEAIKATKIVLKKLQAMDKKED